jgi:hypothetical protein
MSDQFKIIGAWPKGTEPLLPPPPSGLVRVDAEKVQAAFDKLMDHAFKSGLYWGKNWERREMINGNVTIDGVVVECPRVHDFLAGDIG